MGDFDIEAYLEEQVQGKEKQHEKSEKRYFFFFEFS